MHKDLIRESLSLVILLDDIVDVGDGGGDEEGEDEGDDVMAASPDVYVYGVEDDEEG